MKPTAILTICLATSFLTLPACEGDGQQRADTQRREELRRIDAGNPTHLAINYTPGSGTPYMVEAKDGSGGLNFDIDGLIAYCESNKYSAIHINYPDDMSQADLHFSNLKPTLASRITGEITASQSGQVLK